MRNLVVTLFMACCVASGGCIGIGLILIIENRLRVGLFPLVLGIVTFVVATIAIWKIKESKGAST